MKRFWFASVLAPTTLVPAIALAQPVTTGGDMPTTLDPGSAPGPAPAPAPSTSGRTQLPPPAPTPLIVVGPDGKITSTVQPPPESGYYVSGGEPLPTDPVEVHAGAVPDLHVVRSGDTLWDISFYYFNNPWEWPKVWSYNPQITNPHWIYPGDLVRLLPRGMFAVTPEPGPDTQTPEPIKSTDPVPAPARRSEINLKQTAFVEKAELEQSIVIDGSVDEKQLLGDGDSVYLSYPEGKPPQVGKKYTIYTPGKSAKLGPNEYGAYVRMLGTLEVVSVKQDKRARGVILSANQEIERGAKVSPLVKTYKNVPPVPPKVDAQGSIIGMLQREQLIGDGELVFLALGKKSGIEVGNRMYVVRRGDGYPGTMSDDAGKDDRRFPARALGEIVIVEVGADVSVGLVTLSVQEMGLGDLAMMQKAE